MMRILIFLKHQVLVDLYSQAGLYRQVNKAVLELKVLLIFYIVQYAFSYILMNSNALLLNHRVVADSVHIQTAGQSNRPQRAVRG